MEDVKRLFDKREYDDVTLHYLEWFVNKFQEKFGKYISKQELIDRIQENLHTSFKFKSLKEENAAGQYNFVKKEIYIESEIINEEKLKEIIFHEMIHCITTQNHLPGCIEKIEIMDDENNYILDNIGFNEGITQWITMKALDLEEYSSYPILTRLTKELAEIIGEEEVLDIAFNRPQEIKEKMAECLQSKNGKKEDMALLLIDIESFFKDFDRIRKIEHETEKDRLLGALFSIKDGFYAYSKKNLLNVYSRLYLANVSNEKEFIQAYNSIQKIVGTNCLNMDISVEVFENMLIKLNEITKSETEKEEVLKSFPKDLSENIRIIEEFHKFQELDSGEKLFFITSNHGYLSSILENGKQEIVELYLNELYEQYGGLEDEEIFIYVLENGLAREILEKSNNFYTTRIEKYCIEDLEHMIYCMYDTSNENEKRLLGIYHFDTEKESIIEMKKIKSGERNGIQADLYTDGTHVVITKNGQPSEMSIIDKENRKYDTYDVEEDKVYESLVEIERDKLKERHEILKSQEELRVPTSILRHRKLIANEIKEKIKFYLSSEFSKEIKEKISSQKKKIPENASEPVKPEEHEEV